MGGGVHSKDYLPFDRLTHASHTLKKMTNTVLVGFLGFTFSIYHDDVTSTILNYLYFLCSKQPRTRVVLVTL